jgi:hypothetical protein
MLILEEGMLAGRDEAAPKKLLLRYREARIAPPATVEESALSEDTDRA